MPKLRSRPQDLLASCGLIGFCVFFLSCSTQVKIPTVADEPVEGLVKDEAARIIAVSEDKDRVAAYRIFLSEFSRRDILGMSIGNRRIYISHKLATLALKSSWYRWLLRQTLAHEIAHETAGHAEQHGGTSLNRGTFGRGVLAADLGLPWNVRLYNYSAEKELEADSKGLGYWQKLGWDCRIWVRILENFEAQNYLGDAFHPTDKRLKQAQRLCAAERNHRSWFNLSFGNVCQRRASPCACPVRGDHRRFHTDGQTKAVPVKRQTSASAERQPAASRLGIPPALAPQ